MEYKAYIILDAEDEDEAEERISNMDIEDFKDSHVLEVMK